MATNLTPPSPLPPRALGTAIRGDAPGSYPEVPASHTVYTVLGTGHFWGFLALVLVLAAVAYATRGGTIAEGLGTIKDVLVPLVTLYLGYIFGKGNVKTSADRKRKR